MFRACIAMLAVPIFLAACGDSAAPATQTQTAGPGGPSAAPPSSEVSTSGDIPDTQAYVAYSVATGGFVVKIPEGWARTQNGTAVTFSSHFDSVALISAHAATAPTTASATAGEIPAIKHGSNSASIKGVTTVTRPGGTAVLIKYQVLSSPDPVTGQAVTLDVERYEFWRNGVEALIVLSAPVGADNVDPWRTVTNSFAWR